MIYPYCNSKKDVIELMFNHTSEFDMETGEIMRIASVRLENLKSFRDSGNITLTPGFNVIVGQNNAGKTTLLQSLSRSSGPVHRSIGTIPTRFSPIVIEPIVTITFEFESGEILDALWQSYGTNNFGVPVSRSQGDFDNQALSVLRSLSSSERFVRFKYVGGRLEDARLSQHFDLQITDSRVFKYSVQREFVSAGHDGNVTQSFAFGVANWAKGRIYSFDAERLNLGEGGIGPNPELLANASNLAQVLHYFKNRSDSRFRRFVQHVRQVFPDITDITIPPISENRARIQIWSIDPETDRDDLAMSLSDCGTGIGQALAMLYVVVNSEYPRPILIDEPQSFLHPGAVRKLFDIFKQYPQHQYIITTHSPTAVTAANPQTILLVRKEGSESKISTIDVNETKQMQLLLSDVGARLSDVFGADNILWVEGQTEEQCFPVIMSDILNQPLLGTSILGVVHTGDLDGKHARTVFQIYKRLSKGKGLLPPAIGFIFDREGRSETEMEDLKRESEGAVRFLSRRLYENYLLNPQAIAELMSSIDGFRDTPVEDSEVANWLENQGWGKDYFPRQNAAEYQKHNKQRDEQAWEWWRVNVHGANILIKMFSDLSETRVSYEKIEYGLWLTRWVIQNAPHDLNEVTNLLREVFPKEAD